MTEQVTIAELMTFIEEVGKNNVKVNWRVNQIAYTQFLAEVQMLGTFTPEGWFTDEYRRTQGWPQLIVKDYLANKAALAEATQQKTERDEILESIRLLQEQVKALMEEKAAQPEPVEPAAEQPAEDAPAAPAEPAEPAEPEETPAEEA